MKFNFNDPTADDSDWVPLTTEERKALYTVSTVILVVLVLAGIIIYYMI